MYDLETDPLETRNLAWEGHKRTQKQQQEFLRLKRQLDLASLKRLQPLNQQGKATRAR
jgi:hypothetical protein